MEQFNDSQLQQLARSFYASGDNSDTKLDLLLDKKELTNSDRNYLVSYVSLNKSKRPVSMGQMKRELLTLIGYKGKISGYAYSSSTVGREELEAIYNHIMGKKS